MEGNNNLNGMFGISSPAFKNMEYIPVKYTGDGENVNPPLTITGTGDAVTYALLVDDLDADNFVHWIIWNIPNHKEVIRIEEGEVPEGAIQGVNSFGKIGYGGPHPKNGEHRYRFMVCALKGTLDLPEGSTLEQVMEAAKKCEKCESLLIGKYKRE